MVTMRLNLSLLMTVGLCSCLADIALAQPSGVNRGATQVGGVQVPNVTYTPLPQLDVPVDNSPPAQAVPSPPPAASQPQVLPAEDATISTRSKGPSRRIFGFSADVGVPDGANLGLVILPTRWLRLSIAGGTNSATFGGRAGIGLIPLGWGPSLNFEVGRFGVGDVNQLIRSTFEVPSWVEPYVQQIGYSYLNSHLGLDFRLGNFMVLIHGGHSFIRATVRSPSAVETQSSSGAVLYRVRLGEDGRVKIQTWSGKIALIYLFAGV